MKKNIKIWYNEKNLQKKEANDMHRKSKKWVNLGIFVFLGILVLIGVVKGISAMVAYDRRVPDDFITVEEVKKGKEYDKEDFPKAIAFKYATKKEAAIVGKEKLLTYGAVKDDRSNSFFAVTKHDEEYTMETGKREGYTTKDLTMFGVIEPFSFEEHAGEIKITFQTKDQYEYFLRDIHEKSAWRDAYEYYKEKGKSSN